MHVQATATANCAKYKQELAKREEEANQIFNSLDTKLKGLSAPIPFAPISKLKQERQSKSHNSGSRTITSTTPFRKRAKRLRSFKRYTQHSEIKPRSSPEWLQQLLKKPRTL